MSVHMLRIIFLLALKAIETSDQSSQLNCVSDMNN